MSNEKVMQQQQIEVVVSIHNNDSHNDCMDSLTAPLNPCSVESIPIPVRLANGQYVWPVLLSCYELITPPPAVSACSCRDSFDESNEDGHGQQQQQQQRRVGQMDLHVIRVPDMTSCKNTSLTQLQFERNHNNKSSQPSLLSTSSTPSEQFSFETIQSHTIHQPDVGGILDGKWNRIPSPELDDDNREREIYEEETEQEQSWCFASAHSDGRIRIHSLYVHPKLVENNIEIDSSNNHPFNLYSMQFLGQSSGGSENNNNNANTNNNSTMNNNNDVTPLCLSLAWNSCDSIYYSRYNRIRNGTDRIVSTYSNGTVAVHDVLYSYNKNTSNNRNHKVDDGLDDDHNVTTPSKEQYYQNNHPVCDSVQIVESDRWLAHTMFHVPSEVWTACFMDITGTTNIVNTNNDVDDKSGTGSSRTEIVLSGGDEGLWKLWDLRCLNRRPVQTVQNYCESSSSSGITCLSPHPKYSTLVAVGSYDESVSIYDIRYLSRNSKKQPLCRTGQPLGGGVWRIKWHPYTTNKMLVAAMHGGCYVYNIDGLDNYSSSYNDHTNDVDAATTMIAKCQKKFCQHKSMVYGVDWLVRPHSRTCTGNGYYEAAMRSVFLWDTQSFKE